MISEFLTKLIDWKEFELFVSDLYKEGDEIIVEHNKTETGKSGASRQTDVKVTHKTKLHTYTTLIECKSWKHRVDRARIDVLASSIDDLNASKGVIFTTKGFQEGAIEYAKFKNIDIFIVRDLTEEEWGLPGRNILIYLQFLNSTIQNFKAGNVEFKPTVSDPPKSIKLDIEIKKDYRDENQFLISNKDGRKGKHLVDLLLDIRVQLLKTIGEQTSLLKKGDDFDKLQVAFKTKVCVDFSDWEFCHLKYPYGFIKLFQLEFEVVSTVDQTKFETDRGKEFDFALVVENYITKQRNVVTKSKTFSTFNISEQLKDNIDKDDADTLKNGSVMKIYLEPYVSMDIKHDTRILDTEDLKLKPK